MRQIKFRAWNPHMKLMGDDFEEINVCSHGIVGEVSNGSIKTTYRDIDGVWKDAPLMQYTGLKDRNGKEVYEGDIVDDQETRPLVVKFIEKHASYGISNSEEEYLFKELHWQELEVIGNIYEHPHLLKEANTHVQDTEIPN